MEAVMLTTVDNPYDPFTQFDDWLSFDRSKGYFTNEYLARIAKTSDELSETDEQLAIQTAINEIVRLNILGIYKKARAGAGGSSATSPPPISLVSSKIPRG